MKKVAQNYVNTVIEETIAKCEKEKFISRPIRLRHCNALVYETENFYLLRSYNTIISCIDKRTKICCDFLRLVYGYTSTSTQHISKFWHDYGAKKVLRWYPI